MAPAEILAEDVDLKALGLSARARGDREAALALFRQLAATNPGDVWLQKEIGTELHELGRLDEAEAVYRAILVQDPSFFMLTTGWLT